MKNENRALASVSALTNDPDEQTTLRHLLDGASRCRERSIPVFTTFLTPGEQALAKNLPLGEGFCLYGGPGEPERRLAAFLPEYMDASYFTDCADEEDFPLCAIRLTRRDKMVSGRSALSHRDYLGSLLGLGIRRETLGDLYVSEESCDVICVRSMAGFLLENVTTVGRVSVSTRAIGLSEVIVPEKKVKVVRDTVASMRLDGIVAAGFSLSRGKAAEAIAAGKCEVNARACEKGDREVHEGDIVSVRGLGRMKLAEVGGNSKKGRIVVMIERYL